MLQFTRSNDERSGSDRRKADRRRGLLPAPTERLTATHVSTAYILVILVLTSDAFLPLGVAVPALYLIPLSYLAIWSTPKQSSPLLLLAGVCSALTVIGAFLSPPGLLWIDMANRVLALVVIGILTLLSMLRKRTEEDIKILRGLLPICSYCKKIRDDHGYWQQVERYISVRSHADFSHGLCPECGPKHFPGLYDGRSQNTENHGKFA